MDRISSRDQALNDATLLKLGQQGQTERTSLERTNIERSNKQSSGIESLEGFDKASISSEALDAWAKEKDVLKFSRLAQRDVPAVDYDKVNRIKNLVDSGRINDYLNTVDTNALVSNLLNSPSGAFLR